MVVSEDRQNIFAAYFRVLGEVNPGISRFRLTGLDPEAIYEVVEILYSDSQLDSPMLGAVSREAKCYRGDELMKIGLVVEFWGDFQSRVWKIKKQ